MFFEKVSSLDDLSLIKISIKAIMMYLARINCVSITALVIVDKLSTMNNSYYTVMNSLWFISISYGLSVFDYELLPISLSAAVIRD